LNRTAKEQTLCIIARVDTGSTHPARRAGEVTLLLTRDFDGRNIRYVARADSTADSIVIKIVAIVVVVVVTATDNAVVVVVVDLSGVTRFAGLIQIAHAHRGSDARRHHRYVLRRETEDRGEAIKF